MSLGSSVGSALGSVGASALDYAGQNWLSKQTQSREKAAADTAFWREADYNDPQQQMARLRAAGLNPNLVYGTGTTGITGNTHASVARVVPGANPGKIVSDSIERYLSTERMRLDNDIARRTAKNLDVQNVKLAREITNLETDNHIKTSAAIAADRENGLLAGTFQSAHDPWYMRFGGRIGALGADMISESKYGPDDFVSSPAVADRKAAPVRLEFDESKRSGYTPRKAVREVHYKYNR